MVVPVYELNTTSAMNSLMRTLNQHAINARSTQPYRPTLSPHPSLPVHLSHCLFAEWYNSVSAAHCARSVASVPRSRYLSTVRSSASRHYAVLYCTSYVLNSRSKLSFRRQPDEPEIAGIEKRTSFKKHETSLIYKTRTTFVPAFRFWPKTSGKFYFVNSQYQHSFSLVAFAADSP